MNEKGMQAVLMGWSMAEKNHMAVVPNSTFYVWEADLLCFTRAWMVHEIEIKVTKADFYNDRKKKGKHAKLQGYSPNMPNYFWYATYDVDITLEDIPEYAGWIVVQPRRLYGGPIWDVVVKKDAPKIHKHKFPENQREKLFNWLSYRVVYLYNKTHWPDFPEDFI